MEIVVCEIWFRILPVCAENRKHRLRKEILFIIEHCIVNNYNKTWDQLNIELSSILKQLRPNLKRWEWQEALGVVNVLKSFRAYA